MGQEGVDVASITSLDARVVLLDEAVETVGEVVDERLEDAEGFEWGVCEGECSRKGRWVVGTEYSNGGVRR